MKRFMIFLVVLLCLSFVVADGEDDILLYRGESIDVFDSTVTIADIHGDNSVEFYVDDFSYTMSTKGRWVTIGPLELKLTAVYNRIQFAEDQVGFRVRGFSFAEEEVVEVVEEVASKVTLFAGESYSYGGHTFTLVRTTDTHADLLIDGVEQSVRRTYDAQVGDVTVEVAYVITNFLDPNLDKADLVFSGADDGSVVATPVVPEPVVLEPVDDGFAETQVITVEPSPSDVVFEKEDIVEPDTVELFDEVEEEAVVLDVEKGFFARLFDALFGVFKN